jgi:hypothetical protein
MSYWAIDLDSLGESLGTKTVYGPYETRAAAENFIMRDFKSWYDHSEIPIADRTADDSGHWVILEQKAVVRPVGRVRLSVMLQTKKEESK